VRLWDPSFLDGVFIFNKSTEQVPSLYLPLIITVYSDLVGYCILYSTISVRVVDEYCCVVYFTYCAGEYITGDCVVLLRYFLSPWSPAAVKFDVLGNVVSRYG